MDFACFSGHHPRFSRRRIPSGALFWLAISTLACAGCQVQDISSAQLQMHQSIVDRDGLTRLQADPQLRMTCASPAGWDKLPLNQNPLYFHQQWRSTDHHLGFGVVYVRTPVPFPAETLVWLAQKHYADSNHNDGSGKILSEWTDTLGRRWFEAENNTYHIRGYAMTHGLSAWLVYSGYRTSANPTQGEIALGAKAAESVAPMNLDN